jgi:thiol-disulfide isomerase/thioredoxin
VSVPAEVLAKIRPTLKKTNETASKGTTSGTSSASKKSLPPAPKEAKKEDCVFEGSAQDFQKLVMDSSVPVLVDIYADWCGPCKQLGPVLENAAMKSGGMFRLVKINSDKHRELAETFGVQGIECTVHTVHTSYPSCTVYNACYMVTRVTHCLCNEWRQSHRQVRRHAASGPAADLSSEMHHWVRRQSTGRPDV